MYKKKELLLKRYKESPRHWEKSILHQVPYTNDLYQGILDFLSKELNLNKLNEINNLFKFFKVSEFSPDELSGVNFITKKLYNLPKDLKIIYYKICNHILLKKKDFLIQRTPTIRVHFQDENCYQFYPFWHSDLILGHPPFEKNIWIPLTKPYGNKYHGFSLSTPEISHKIFNQFCTKDPYLSKDDPRVIKNKEFLVNSEPCKCLPGEALEFDSRIFHSALNFENNLRLSLDIRIISRKYLKRPYPIYRGLGRMKMLFDEKNYFISKEELNKF